MCEKFGFMVHCDHRAKTRMQAQRALGMHVVRQERHYAYTTLVASADLLPPAIAFAQSLRLTGTIHDLVLMVDESAGEVAILLLRTRHSSQCAYDDAVGSNSACSDTGPVPARHR